MRTTVADLSRFHVQRSQLWRTPVDVYQALDAEFGFTLDPCPPNPKFDGLCLSWRGERIYCNPPYNAIEPWLSKAHEADLAVFLLPSRTGTQWWMDFAPKASEIRWIRGRINFQGGKSAAPEWSVLLIFRGGA